MGADNRREFDHIGQFNFIIEIEGMTAGRFKGVDGLDSETEVVEYQDGEDRILRKRPGRTKYSNLVLKRGYADKSMEELWIWRKAVMDGKVERKSGSVVLQNDHGLEVCRYNFFHSWPCKWKGWDLDGKGTDNVAEEIELAVEEIVRVKGGDQA
jgi:phage tail-like protein